MAHMLTTAEFDTKVLKSSKVVLIDLYADWCGPCKMLGPIVEEVAEEQGDKYDIFKLNVDEAPEIAEKYGVMSIPTMIFFKDGQEVFRSTGVKEKEWIVAKLEELA